jgi:hypothetical protein
MNTAERSTALRLTLYVHGGTTASVRAERNVRAAMERFDVPAEQLELIDVFTHGERAMCDGVLLTPTLLRVEPRSSRSLVR